MHQIVIARCSILVEKAKKTRKYIVFLLSYKLNGGLNEERSSKVSIRKWVVKGSSG